MPKPSNIVKYPPTLAVQKPDYVHIVKAVNYWVLLDDLAHFFAESQMPEVSMHLAAACEEIDRIWENGQYDTSQKYTC